MKTEYFNRFKADKKLQSSLELLRFFALEKACSTLEGRFALIFSRIADRCLYHSLNVWVQFIDDLNIPGEFLKTLTPDARLQTNDTKSKYEIEAFLGAVKVLFEDNFKGPKGQNILGVCFGHDVIKLNELRKEFDNEKDIIFTLSNKIRNHAYHLNKEFRDVGLYACVERNGDLFVVAWPNIYVDDKGQPLDLAKVFIDANHSTTAFIGRVRDMLLSYFVEKYGQPQHDTCISITTRFGNIVAILGPKGFVFNDGTTLT